VLILPELRFIKSSRRRRRISLLFSVALHFPQIHAKAAAPVPHPQQGFDFWEWITSLLQRHDSLGVFFLALLALAGYFLSQAQNWEALLRLLGRSPNSPKSPNTTSNETHGDSNSVITGEAFSSGSAQFIGGRHIHHNHLPSPPKSDLPEKGIPNNPSKRTSSIEQLAGRESLKQVSAERLIVEEASLIEELRITTELEEAGVITRGNAIILQNQRIAEIRILRLSKL
jgi:hypothetical protein